MQLWLIIQFTQQTYFFWKFQNLSLLQLISKLHPLSLNPAIAAATMTPRA